MTESEKLLQFRLDVMALIAEGDGKGLEGSGDE
jgi:hypothetical protein